MVLVAVIVVALALRWNQLSSFNINWDEFFYLSQVYDYLRGDLTRKLQTVHVHLFGWLPSAAGNEVDQIVAARAVMAGLQCITAWSLYRIARRFTDARAALFAVAGYLSFSYVIRHGTSFRTDPIATCVLMVAFDLLLTPSLAKWRAAVAGTLFATGVLTTIKSAIFGPTLLVLAALPTATTARAKHTRIVVMLLAGVVAFGSLYAIHALTLSQGRSDSSATDLVLRSLSKTVIEPSLLPRRDTLIVTLRWDLAFWAFGLVGAGILAGRVWRASEDERLKLVNVAALALPIASVAVYRNSFPYFYPFILAPASVLTAMSWQALSAYSAVPTLFKMFAITWFLANLILHGVYAPRLMPLAHQREVLTAVHQAFPDPVRYLDRSSMISSFPQVGFFMSTWGLEAYTSRGTPILREAIEEQRPPLLLANHPLLDIENAVYPPSTTHPLQLLPADREALAGAYIHHWGPIYVAGQRLEVTPTSPTRLVLSIAGRYTLEGNGQLRIDGHPVEPGQVLELTRGIHWVATEGSPGQATLRWGEHLYRPDHPPPDKPLFLGF